MSCMLFLLYILCNYAIIIINYISTMYTFVTFHFVYIGYIIFYDYSFLNIQIMLIIYDRYVMHIMLD